MGNYGDDASNRSSRASSSHSNLITPVPDPIQAHPHPSQLQHHLHASNSYVVPSKPNSSSRREMLPLATDPNRRGPPVDYPPGFGEPVPGRRSDFESIRDARRSVTAPNRRGPSLDYPSGTRVSGRGPAVPTQNLASQASSSNTIPSNLQYYRPQ